MHYNISVTKMFVFNIGLVLLYLLSKHKTTKPYGPDIC